MHCPSALVNDSATFTIPESDDEETGEDLGGPDDLLASLRSDEAPSRWILSPRVCGV